MKRRVVITGVGAVTAAGRGAIALWQAARSGTSGVRTFKFDQGQPLRLSLAAHLPDFDAAPVLGEQASKTMDRFSMFAAVAADEACSQAGIGKTPTGERCSVIVGSGIGGATTFDEGCYRFYQDLRVDPMTIPKVMPNAAASHISMRYGARGPSFCVSSACSSSAQAIGLGLQHVRHGLSDMVIAGGAECQISPAVMRAWELLRVVSPTVCRPFSLKRDGMVLGEGAAFLVLESLDHAQARGATILAELAGYGTTSDAADLLRPSVDGPRRAIEGAIADAGLQASEIGYVNAHGTATVLNDAVESEALRTVFGTHDVAVSSTKPIHGHAMGAAGAIELLVALHALREQVAPPTINWLERDPKCNIDPVPNQARAIKTKAVMSNSFAFGGINASLIARTFEG